MKQTVLTCIVCPSSCRITVKQSKDGIEISGNRCKRGLEHAKNEIKNPMRVLTSTVAVEGGSLRCLPVISSKEVPKNKLKECLNEIYSIKIQAPVKAGDIIIKNICDTDADIIAARSMKQAASKGEH